MKKILVFVSVVLSLTMLLSACGKSASSESSAAAPEEEAPQTQEEEQAAPEEKSEESAEPEEEPETAAKDVKVVKWADTGTTAEFEQELTPGSIAVKRMGDKLEELSGGSMVLQIFPDGQLGSSNDEIISGLKTGAFEASCQATGNWAEYTDAFYFMNVPFLYQTAEEVYHVIDGPIGQAAYAKAQEDTGIYVLGMMDIGFRQITSNDPVHTAADLKGVKIRTMVDDIQVASFQALGAAVTPLSYGELFTALQQGLVDAQENPLSNILASRFYEVQDYLTLTGHSYTLSAFAFSPVFIESLTEEELGWLKEAVRYGEEQGRIAAAEMEADMLEQLSAEMEVYTPTAEELQTFVDGVAPAWEKVEELMGTDAYNELLQTVEDFRAAS